MWAKKDFYLCWLVTQWQYWCSSWNDLSTAWIKMMWAKKRLLSLLTCHSVAILMFFVEWSLNTAWIRMMWARKRDFYLCWLVTQWQYWCSSWNDFSTAWIKMMWAKKKTSISADLSLSGNIDVLREMISQPLELRWCEQKKDFYLCWLVTQWQYWCSSWNDLSTAWIRMMWAKKRLLYLLTCHSVAILMFFVKWSLNRLN